MKARGLVGWQFTHPAPSSSCFAGWSGRCSTRRLLSTAPATEEVLSEHLNPRPDAYSATPFVDSCVVSVRAGGGGNGCVSFLRDKYISAGPANGGDGGTGGNIYIEAVKGETSLHKVKRQHVGQGGLRAGRGEHGTGRGRGGKRGEDLILTVPIGTVVRELDRLDPFNEANARWRVERKIWKQQQREMVAARTAARNAARDADGDEDTDSTAVQAPEVTHAEPEARPPESLGPSTFEWLMYPGSLPSDRLTTMFPMPPRPKRSTLAAAQARAPIFLDLDQATAAPWLLAAGAMGGLGNTHFVSKDMPRPRFATRGHNGVRLQLQLDLKMLADVGLVGLPNAGKSTLLRALSNSRTRVGNWPFTTLQPSVGTLVLDDGTGRPLLQPGRQPRASFSIADIPGLIEGAHDNRGLGLGFLRHIERAAILAFVVDLSAGDVVTALRKLWQEVGAYDSSVAETAALTSPHSAAQSLYLPPPIISKPWMVVATKADLVDSRAQFSALQAYLAAVADGTVEHPSGRKDAWRRSLHAVPVSAIRAEGVSQIPRLILDLLDG